MRIHIPEDRLSHHIQIVGASGTRKSSIIRGFVDQAVARGWPCIFLDVKLDYLEEYYVPGHSNLISYRDERCIRWRIDQEANDEPAAFALSQGAFPDQKGTNYFFLDHAQAIFAYLVGVHRPTLSQLAGWFADPKLVREKVKGSEHYNTLDPKSEGQSQGVISTMNHIGRVLRWMPDDEGRREFSVREWAKSGKNRGHIFLSSDSETLASMRPLHALMLDLLFIQIRRYGGPALFVLDEIPRLGRVPQYEPALSLQRSSGCPIISAYQGFSQLEDTYGDRLAESIGSNAYTNIVLRTMGERSTKHCSSLLGMATQKERERETKPKHWWRHTNHSTQTERVMESAVTPGEIQSLDDGYGYLAQAGYITPINVKWRPSQKRVPRLIERTVHTKPNVITVKPAGSSRYSQGG